MCVCVFSSLIYCFCSHLVAISQYGKQLKVSSDVNFFYAHTYSNCSLRQNKLRIYLTHILLWSNSGVYHSFKSKIRESQMIATTIKYDVLMFFCHHSRNKLVRPIDLINLLPGPKWSTHSHFTVIIMVC